MDVLGAPVDGPWLKLSEAVDVVDAVSPRVAVPIHEAEATEPEKLIGWLERFSTRPVRALPAGEPVSV